MTNRLGLVGLAAAAMVASLGSLHCGGDDATTGGGGTGGNATGAGGTGTGSSGGTGTGGSATGTGGMGGAGGSSPCLPASEHDGVFTLDVPELCLVARYDAPFTTASYTPPTWGRHGGPLTMTQAYDGPTPTDELTLTRWAVPSEPTGALTVMEMVGPLDAGVTGSDPFFAGLAVDLPDTPLTIVGWADATLAGQIIALDGTSVAGSWDLFGYYWGAAVSDGSTTRLLHSSLSEVGAPALGDSGAYAADWDAAAPADPTGATIDNWGLANGPITVDGEGNAFAVMTDYVAGNQTLRAWASTTVAPGTTGPAAGTELWDMPGFGSSLAAMAPSSSGDGLTFFQAQTFDGNGVVNDDVTLQRYEVVAGEVAAVGAPTVGIDLTEDDTEVLLFTDDAGRLWLGVGDGAAGSVLYVLERTP